jgi:hypothetical protein
LFVATGGDVTARKVGANSRSVGLVHSVGDGAILRLRLDERRERLWILEPGAIHVIDLATDRRIASAALQNWLHASGGTNCLPDLQLDARGAAIVTDNVQPKLWRIDAETFSVVERRVRLDSQKGVDAGFSALAIAEDGSMFAAMAAPGSLWRISSDLGRARRIALDHPIYGACGLETVGIPNARGRALFVLTSGHDRLQVQRIDLLRTRGMTPAKTAALVSVAVPGSLVASRGALHLALASEKTSEDRAHLSRDKARFLLVTVAAPD